MAIIAVEATDGFDKRDMELMGQNEMLEIETTKGFKGTTVRFVEPLELMMVGVTESLENQKEEEKKA